MPSTLAPQPFTDVVFSKTIAPLLSWMLALCLGLHPGTSYAKPKNLARVPHTEVSKNKKSTKLKQERTSSEESRSERDRRLYRECKGRPNAGACLGYTQAH